MKTTAYIKITLIQITMLCVVLANASLGATFIVDFPKTSKPHLDPYYNTLDAGGNFVSGDGNSSVFEGVARDGNVTADLSGRFYDSDALDPGTTGLLNSDLLWNRKDQHVPEPGWLVRFGLAPDSVGEFIHTYNPGGSDEKVVPASYISFRISSPEEVVFEDISLQIKAVDGVGPNTIWAATSTNGFSDATLGAVGFSAEDGYTLSWQWDRLGAGGNGMEVRVYGFIGADEGTFGTGLVTGTYEPPPLPEPSTGVLLLGAGLRLALGRKRRRVC